LYSGSIDFRTMFHLEEINIIKDRLTDQEQTIAVAESVTAGLLQLAFASAEEAAKYFQGGITAYNIGQKCRHLNINPIHAETCNCVSAKMAEDMALNICTMFTSNWGVAITGYSTPVPQSDDQRFAYYAVAYNGKIVVTEKIETEEEDVLKVQQLYVNTIVDKLAGYINENAEQEFAVTQNIAA
jgi:nicotinamide-nucleotide amidase